MACIIANVFAAEQTELIPQQQTAKAIFSKLIFNNTMENETSIPYHFERQLVDIKFEVVPLNSFAVFHHHLRNFNTSEIKPNFKIILSGEILPNLIIVNSYNKYYPFIHSFTMPVTDYQNTTRDQMSSAWRTMFESIERNLGGGFEFYYERNQTEELRLNFYVFGDKYAKVENGIHALIKGFGDAHSYFAYAFEADRFAYSGQSIKLTFQ